jgi:cation diffusion facilitator family transporter
MPDGDIDDRRHDHSFGQERRRPGERRTRIVIGITAAMMGVEIAAGLAFGSMALLADGLHMASHAVALGISAFAYAYARRHAHDEGYSFGTGKVNALGGYTGAVLLAVFALFMAWESLARLLHPVAIALDQALLVAILGLVVNGVSMYVLDVRDDGHQPGGGDGAGDGPRAEAGDGHDGEPDHHRASQHPDHNLRSAYLHVMADALTSVLAIAALLAAKYLGLVWMDPVMGLVGAALVGRWSLGLLGATSSVLTDRQGPAGLRERIQAHIEADGHSRVTDLHLWSIGPGLYAAVLVVVAEAPASADEYRDRLPRDAGLAHVTVEVHHRAEGARAPNPSAP